MLSVSGSAWGATTFKDGIISSDNVAEDVTSNFYADAQNNLGAMYGNGRGVVKDYVTAHMLGATARANGSDNGGKLVDLLEPLMIRPKIAAAQERASTCVARQYRECYVGTARWGMADGE